ncbi:FimV family protein [Argonema antarcticum]|uniref:type IV pilus assembly protein FimV n=1 Tax=Argonema antarcticum TaxID=2942763 RepID=UPI0020125D7E|nr:hypothetical protein [Argonema antarcticum]MCL1470498.1 hypothetical protein [Argonema antarcticum A004/B2]
MEYWEFLIQKEGDRTWQPLESPDVELQQGRYRILARSGRTDTEVDIRIIHQSTDEDPPKRRMQKRSRRTNSEGLMVLIPFTHLKPGIWELRCRPDLITDLMGDSWKHTLRLQVLPTLEDTPAQAAAEDGSAGVSLAELGDISESPVLPTESPIPEAQSNPDIPPKTAAPEESNPWAPVLSPKPTNANSHPLLLILKQQTYIARHGQPINLSGQVALPETSEDRTASPPPIFSGELRIRLRDPQNAKILADRQQLLSAQAIPFTFACDIEIPPNSKTHLVLGEITLYNATETPDDPPLVLASKSFSITADLDDLLSAFAESVQQNETDFFDPASAESGKGTTEDDREEISKTPLFRPLEPSVGQSLPPLLHKPDPTKSASKRLDLPTFGNTSKFAPAANTETQAESESANLTAAESEVQSTESETEEVSPSITEQDSTPEAATAAPEVAEPQTEVTETQPDAEPSPEDIAFQSLKLEDRFWSRLNSLATDAELSAELNIDDILDTDNTQAELPAILSDRSTGTEADLTAYEIVVDDEPLEPLPQKATKSQTQDLSSNPDLLSSESATISQDEGIPMPELEVPKGELIGGQPVRIRIKMPLRQPRLGVKLWVLDRQTRSILESPRWIGDFVPDPWGKLESMTQVTVPLGCLAIRFEAIGVEIHTQRESHKATIDRNVIPPDLPTFPLDDLDV